MENKRYSLLAFLFIVVAIFSYIFLLSWNIECESNNSTITILEGSSVTSVANLLYQKKCFSKIDITIFKIMMRVTLKENKIYAGRYNLDEVSKLGELIQLITSSSGNKVKLTFIEGWSIDKYPSQESTLILNLCSI